MDRCVLLRPFLGVLSRPCRLLPLRKLSSETPSSRTHPTTTSSLYAILGVASDATQSEIKAAFYHKSKIYHPDVTTDLEMRLMFIDVSEAYEILGNARLRRSYDRGLLVPKSGVYHSMQMEEVFNPFANAPLRNSDRRVPTVKQPAQQEYTEMSNFDEFYKQTTLDHFYKKGASAGRMINPENSPNSYTSNMGIILGSIVSIILLSTGISQLFD